MIRYLANLITVCRIICSILLLWTVPFSAAFYALYTLCGVTDIADGAVARKTQTTSRTGAMLDSLADVVCLTVVLVKLIPVLRLSKWIWCGIVLVAVIRCLSYLIGALKYRRFAALHTVLNKLTGLLLFFVPYAAGICDAEAFFAILCIAAGVSSAEELAIMVISKYFDPNIPSIFYLIT